MFLDNASSHSHELRLSHVQLKFLPANTTSVLQPLDQGIIRAFKARYRKLMIKSLLSKIEQTESASELCKEISILDAIYWISKAWNDTKDSTIVKCFRLAGFSTDNNNDVPDETEDEDDEEDDIPLIQLARQLRELPQEYDFNFDATIPTEEDSTEREKDLLGPYQRDETIVCEQEEEEEKEEEKLFTMSELETLRQVRKIHAETTADFIRPLTGDIIMKLEDSFIVKKKCRTTQSTIDMFFKELHK